MKIVSVIVGIVLFVSSVVKGAELVVECDEEAAYLSFSLHLMGNGEFKSRGPDNSLRDQMSGKLLWKNLESGSYRIVIAPEEEDWAPCWIGIQTVQVKEGQNVVELRMPEGSFTFSVTFDGVKAPEQYSNEKSPVFRVERMMKDGTVDPFFRQWLWSVGGDSPPKGTVGYLLPGRYKFTAFTVNEEFETRDLAFGVVALGPEEESGKIIPVVINQIIERDTATITDVKSSEIEE